MNDQLRPGHIPGSFSGFLAQHRPDLLPRPGAASSLEPPHGTTVLALRFAGGVVIAGDRQATSGYTVASREIQKVFPTDSHSAIAIAGVAGPAVEMVRLFQTELEFYEKVNGESLSLDGKANYLAHFIRGNFPAAMQGLVVLPIYAGYDTSLGTGRLFRFDVTGGRWEENEYLAEGSGSLYASTSLKKTYSSPSELDREGAIRLALEALVDAADEDVATAGPDVRRGIYPTIYTITAAGCAEVPSEDVAEAAAAVLAQRTK